MISEQLKNWLSDFGKDYSERNSQHYDDYDQLMEELLGTKKSEIFSNYLLPHLEKTNSRILEVGCNIGNQLALLHKMLPNCSLVGLEPQKNAIEEGKSRHPFVEFVNGTAFEIPYPDNSFDLIMTNGVLIHIHPDDHKKAISEILRCSKSHIFLHEYYCENLEEVEYRGENALLWRADFVKIYQTINPNLKVLENHLFMNKDGSSNQDQIALLQK